MIFSSQRFLQKRTNEFYFTTMKPQIDLFSFVFWRKLKTPKIHFAIKWPITCSSELRYSELCNCWNAKLACPVVSLYLVVGHNPKVVATYSMSTGVCHLLTIREMTFLHAEQIFLTAKTHLLKITLESHAKFNLWFTYVHRFAPL